MKRVVILLHDSDRRRGPQGYLIHALAEVWRKSGLEVSWAYGIRNRPEADLLIPQVDLTRLPDRYIEHIRSYPNVVNGKVVDISKLGLNYVRIDGGQVRIGSTTTLTDILEDKTIGKTRGIEALFDALRAINPVQIRNVATVGGEVCGANPLFDVPPVLIALNARARAGD